MSSSPEVGATVLVEVARAATGGAVGRLESGEVIFVRHALPGERVTARVVEVAKNFLRADAIGVDRPSPDRVDAPCRYAAPGGCGGCDLQHASMAAQAQWKADVVTEHLRRIARVELDVTVIDPGVDARGSRTRLRCAVDEEGRLGLRRAGSRQVVELDACWLADDRLTAAFARMWPGSDEVELRAIGDNDAFAVTRRDVGEEVEYRVCTLEGEPLPVGTASKVIVGGQSLRVGPLSFWQSHRQAPEILLAAVTNILEPTVGDHVVDLYSGVGLFAVPLAARVGPTGRVDAVESSSDAADDLRHNARGLRHLHVREWRVAPRAINDVVTEGSKVVLDPPRAGVGVKTMAALVARRPRRLAYVSCDAATFARDLKVALDAGYSLTSLKVHDLFPMTEHVELIAALDAPH